VEIPAPVLPAARDQRRARAPATSGPSVSACFSAFSFSSSKLTAFDFISTVALGSMVATTILSNNVPLDKAILGFVLLFGVQKLVLWLSTKSHRFRELVTAHSTLVFCRGEMLQEVMEQHQLTETEVLAAIRNHGHHSLEGIEFVIMEQDGSFSVIPRSATGAASAMADVPEFR
jgi:uncharacterized membrane protein YcaP (DUF421 family)